MDLFDELENMAICAVYDEPGEDGATVDPSQTAVKMWQEHFGYTYEEAVIMIGITTISTKRSASNQQSVLTPARARAVYLFKLEGPISTPSKIQIAANLPNVPESHQGTSDEGNSVFCKVDGRTKMAIESWLAAQKGPNFRPLFVPVGQAHKELSPQSIYPTLGKDATLPHFRPQDPHLLNTVPSFGRMQDQYPVWYFFYGTLARTSRLMRLLSLSESEIPILHTASVTGGIMRSWGGGKYNALVDGSEISRVEGSAYQVMSEEHEDALRKYETEAYEVVRCLIKMNGISILGCTFRYIGEID